MGGDEFITTNILGTKRLLDHVAAHPGMRLVQVSTDEVYGDVAAPHRSREVDPLHGSSPYAAAKAAAELMVAAYVRTYGIEATIVRGANAYGPNQFPEKFIPVLAINTLEGRPLPVYGDGQQVREFTHVTDFAAGHRGGAAARPAGRGVQLRLRAGAGEPRDRPSRGRDPRGRRGADPARRRPPRPRPPLRDRLHEAAHPRLGAAGRRSPTASARRSSGTARTRRGGARSRPAVTTRTTSPPTTAAGPAREGHRPRGRRRHAPAPGHARHLEAAAAGLRQADGLLPAVDADAGRDPRDPGDLDAARPAAVPAAARRRLAVRHRALRTPSRTGRAGSPTRSWSGREFIGDDCRGAGPRRQHLPRRGPRRHPAGRGGAARRLHAVRLPRARPRALRRRRRRRRRRHPRHRGEARGTALEPRRDRPLPVRQRRSSTIAANLAPSARGEIEITDANNAYVAAGRARLVELGRGHGVARHRHARLADRGVAVHPGAPAPPGRAHRVPRGGRVPDGLHRRRASNRSRPHSASRRTATTSHRWWRPRAQPATRNRRMQAHVGLERDGRPRHE